MVSTIFCCSVVGTETGYGLGDRGIGVQVPVAYRVVTFPYCPYRLEAQPACYPVGTRSPFSGDKSAGARS
jgi:hypothetical protein